VSPFRRSDGAIDAIPGHSAQTRVAGRALCSFRAARIVVMASAVLAAAIVVPATGDQVSPAAPPQRMASTVLKDMPALSALAPDAGPATEVIIRWTVSGPATVSSLMAARDVTSSRFDLVQRRTVSFSPVRERDPQLSPDDLVVIAVDAQGRELGWQRLKDPRLIRSEQPDDSGMLHGQVFYRAEADLIVWIPDRAAPAELRIYAPDWNGQEYVLRGLGSVPFSRP